MNVVKYPRASEVARRYLSAPSTSVASKQLFSSAGDLYSDSRGRLSGHRADMLLFINLKYMTTLCLRKNAETLKCIARNCKDQF